MSKIFAFSAILFFAIYIQSCNKDKDIPTKKCRLTTLTQTPGVGEAITFSIGYNSDNMISQIVSSESPAVTTTFTYIDNTIIKLIKSGEAVTSKTVIYTNAMGFQTHSEVRDLNTDTVISYSDYEYNNKWEIKTVTETNGNSEPIIANYTYSEGNLMSISKEGILTTWEYDTDQAWRVGDYFQVGQLFGTGNAFFVINKNLVKSHTQSGSMINFTYIFDSDNNIAQMDIIYGSETNITTYAFQQICE